MSDVQLGQLVAVVIFGAAFLDGAINTRELWRIHRDAKLPGKRITFAFYAIAVLIVVFAGLVGGVTLRSLFGFDRLPGAAVVLFVLGVAILFIPRFEVWTVARIRRGDR